MLQYISQLIKYEMVTCNQINMNQPATTTESIYPSTIQSPQPPSNPFSSTFPLHFRTYRLAMLDPANRELMIFQKAQ